MRVTEREREREREGEKEKKRVKRRAREGGDGRGEQRSACMIFQYCRSTLSPIFAADYISLLPYPNPRDHFTMAARFDLREEALEWNRSVPVRLRRQEGDTAERRETERERERERKRRSEIW